MHEDHIHSLKQRKQCVSLKQLINALTTITHISHTLVLELIACLEHNHVNTHVTEHQYQHCSYPSEKI